MASVLTALSTVICSADFRYAGSTDVESSAHLLLGVGLPTVVVTQGAGPVLWWSAGRSGSLLPPRVEPVDTAGAGDVFHGAYCFYAANGTSDIASLLEGAAPRLASMKCAHFGPRSWPPRPGELSEWTRPPTV